MNTKEESAVDKLEVEFRIRKTYKKVSYEETVSFCKNIFTCDKNSASVIVSLAAPYIICCATIGKIVG